MGHSIPLAATYAWKVEEAVGSSCSCRTRVPRLYEPDFPRLLIGTGCGAQLWIVIGGPEILESTRRITSIVLDKTGTLTEGFMNVVDVLADVQRNGLRFIS